MAPEDPIDPDVAGAPPTSLEALMIAEEQHRILAENADDVFWILAPDGQIVYISPQVEHVRGYTPEEAMRQGLDEIHPPSSQAINRAYFAELFAALERGDALPTFRGEMEYFCKDGSIFWGEVHVMPRTDAAGNLVALVGVTRDITERKRLEAELRAANARLEVMARTDPLTGVGNRRDFLERAETEIARMKRTRRPASVLLLDVDRFKWVNDRHGHAVGDAVLVGITHRLTTRLRVTDTLARWGGEEFVILLPETTLPDALHLAEVLRQSIGDEPFPGAGTVTVSIGAAEVQPGEPFDRWLERVDTALYAAKAAGRDQVQAAPED